MRTALLGILIAAPMALASFPAQAQQASAAASAAIARGDWAKAERALLAELRIHPDRPELLLNLAAVYVGTGRQLEARGLYEKVLAQEDVLMDLDAERTAGSHAIARTGLRRLARVRTASN